jgi:hypothetical protein
VNDLARFRDHVIRARRIASHTADRRIRMLLEILVKELEQKIAEIERRQGIETEGCAAPPDHVLRQAGERAAP